MLSFWEDLWKGELTLNEKLMFCSILSRFSPSVVLHAMRDCVVEGKQFRPNPGEIRSLCMGSAPTHSPPGEEPDPNDVVPPHLVSGLIKGLIDDHRKKGHWFDPSPEEVRPENHAAARIRKAMRSSGTTTLVKLVISGHVPKRDRRFLANMAFSFDKKNKCYRTVCPPEGVDVVKRMCREFDPPIDVDVVGDDR